MSSTTTFVNPWHPDDISPLDTGARSPAKYPSPCFEEIAESTRPTKRATKQGGGSKKKKRPNLKLDLSKKEGRIQTTLDRWLFKPKAPTHVRFVERVLLKEYTPRTESWTMVPLKGFSEPGSAFSLKRSEMKRTMASQHYWRRQRPLPKTVRKVTHILKTMQRENTKLGY